MADAYEARVAELVGIITRGHSGSVAEADRALRQLEILTGDAAISTRLMHDPVVSGRRRAVWAGKQSA